MDPGWKATTRPGLEPVSPPVETPGDRLRSALYLHESALQLMRQNLRRRHPESTEAELRAALLDWLWTRPGAERGDGPGLPRTL